MGNVQKEPKSPQKWKFKGKKWKMSQNSQKAAKCHKIPQKKIKRKLRKIQFCPKMVENPPESFKRGRKWNQNPEFSPFSLWEFGARKVEIFP